MAVALYAILLVLNIVNVIVHSIGSYLLIHLYPKSRQKAQRLYLIHLSISECLINLLEAIRTIPQLISVPANHSNGVKKFRDYVLIINFTCVSCVYYFDMMFMTFDRLMLMTFSVNYNSHWNERKAGRLLLATWLCAAIFAVTVCVGYSLKIFVWMDLFFEFFCPIVDFLFIILAVATYTFIFNRYKKGRFKHNTALSNNASVLLPDGTRNNSRYKRFKNSVFYIPVLLITTFLLFMATPDLTYLFVGIIGNNHSTELFAACWISYSVSALVDAYIYIYLQKDVRRLFGEKIKRWYGVNCYGSHVGESPIHLNRLDIPKQNGSLSLSSSFKKLQFRQSRIDAPE